MQRRSVTCAGVWVNPQLRKVQESLCILSVLSVVLGGRGQSFLSAENSIFAALKGDDMEVDGTLKLHPLIV